MVNMKYILLISTLFSFLLLQGCLIVHKVTYKITMNSAKKGTVTVSFSDIRSDAIGNKEFAEDRSNLFDYMLKSSDFAESMKMEGKIIRDRKLSVTDGKLNGQAVYDFNDIEKVEGFRLQDGLYYLTLQTEDSVLTTNGEVLRGDGYKRIMWGADAKKLEFEILSGQTAEQTRDLVQYYRP